MWSTRGAMVESLIRMKRDGFRPERIGAREFDERVEYTRRLMNRMSRAD